MLPQLSDIPRVAVLTAAMGYVYGSLFKVNPRLAACAVAVSSVGNIILFAVANPILQGDANLRSLKIYMATYTIAMTVSVIAFRELQLIATLGTVVLFGYAARQLLRIVSHLQKLEDLQVEIRNEQFKASEAK